MIISRTDILTDTHPSTFAVVPVLVRIAAYSGNWIRDPESWSDSGGGNPLEIFRSLVDHLFARWKMPDFFFSAWLVKGEVNYLERNWYCIVAAGGSLRMLPGMPPSITSRALHLAVSAPAGLSVRQALRWGQVKALGGSDELLAEVLSSRMVKDLSNHAIWSRLLEKVIASDHFLPGNFGIIVDTLRQFILEEKYGRVYSILKLSFRELLRYSRRYWKKFVQLSGATRMGETRTDIHCGNLRAEVGNQNAVRWQRIGGEKTYMSSQFENGKEIRWKIEELTNQYQLTAEGIMMRHCVGTYARVCKDGGCAIFSLRTDDEVEGRSRSVSHLTIEVTVTTRKVRFVMGKWNRKYYPAGIPLLRQWAKDMKFSL